MIKHLGEELTPFEDCGFAREPEMPLIGQDIRVNCRVDQNSAEPALTLRDAAGERELKAAFVRQEGESRYYAFALKHYDECSAFDYRISAGTETTPWFTVEVLRKECYTRALAMSAGPGMIGLSLADDLSLRLTADGGVILAQEPLNPGLSSIAAPARLPLDGGGELVCGGASIWELKRLSESMLKVTAYTVLRNAAGVVRKAAMTAEMSARHVMGTGERFDRVDQFGGSTNGRVVEKFTHQGEQAYLPIPFFFTEQGWGLYRESDIPAQMRFGSTLEICQETEGTVLTRDRLLSGDPPAMLQQYFHCTGCPALPPEWAFGVWISGNGWNDDAEVDAQLAALKRYDYPASVMVLEQWSDERTFYLWHGERFPAPADTVRRIREAGLHLILWQIPVIKHEWEGEAGEALLRDTEEAVRNRYVVVTAEGEPYHITEKWFHHSLLPDFTNPDTLRWWFGKREYLLRMGVEGFKTDGGEFLFDKTARLHSGIRGRAAHNLYPMQYERAYNDFLKAHSVQGVTFSRAGYAGAQTLPIHWAGDQKSEWSELQAQLRAGISAGLSGVLFWGFDIGGFAGPIPGKELYLRATALSCFTPIMQWHAEPRGGQFGGEKPENNDRSPWNLARRLKDDDLLVIACRFARLRERLRPYLWQEAKACAEAGRPMMAHLCFDYPEDPIAWRTDDEFMLGRELLVAPITAEGAEGREVYLPAGEWSDFFTGERVQGGRALTVRCPLDSIPVYRRD